MTSPKHFVKTSKKDTGNTTPKGSKRKVEIVELDQKNEERKSKWRKVWKESPCETTNQLIVLKKMTRKLLSKSTQVCDIYMYATFYSNKQESEKQVSIVCIVKSLKIPKFNLEIFCIIAAFLAFMALWVKSLRSAEFLCQNGPDKLKKS